MRVFYVINLTMLEKREIALFIFNLCVFKSQKIFEIAIELHTNCFIALTFCVSEYMLKHCKIIVLKTLAIILLATNFIHQYLRKKKKF